MRVIYSIGAKFGGHGIGYQAVQAATGIYRSGSLLKVLASYRGKTLIPPKVIQTMGIWGRLLRRLAYYDSSGRGIVLHDTIFDKWAVSHLIKCDIFHGWNHHCLLQLRKAKSLGALTFVERASSHILQGEEILRREYQKYGVSGSFWPKEYVERSLAEYEEADYIIVPSDYAYKSFLERGFDPQRVIKIPFGVDAEKFRSVPVASRISGFVALFVGEIRLGKGVQYLLEAWDSLRLKDAELWLAGEVKNDFQRVAAKYRNRRDVKFLGFRRDIPLIMRQASVFVFPSLDEGSALSIFEALVMGVPVITTPNAGSIVRDSLDGYLVPIRDSRALAERIKYFYDYPGDIRVMGENAKERAKEYTWKQYGDNLVRAYRGVVELSK